MVVFAGLSGCTVIPKVQYHKIKQHSDLTQPMFDSFSLQQSEIRITVGKDAKTGLMNPSSMAASSIPVEFNEFKIGIIHADSWGIKTNLNITKIDNTDLAKEIGTEVVDKRQTYIEKGFGFLTKLATVPFSSVSGADINAFPMTIDTSSILVGNKVFDKATTSDISAKGGSVFISFGALPKDAKPIDDLPEGVDVSSFYYSACRAITIKVKIKDDVSFEKSMKIADPRYFQAVGFPVKGKITMHSECGSSVTTDKDASIKSNMDIADTVITQYTAFKAALDKKEEENK